MRRMGGRWHAAIVRVLGRCHVLPAARIMLALRALFPAIFPAPASLSSHHHLSPVHPVTCMKP